MANTLNFAIIYTAIDRMSEVTEKIGSSFVTAGEKVRGFGEHITAVGEKIALTSAIVTEGAERLHQWSDALFEPAASMEETMNRAAAMTTLSADALEKLKDRAIEFSNLRPGATAEQYVEAYTSMRSILGDTAQTAIGTTTALMLAKVANIDAASSAGLLTEVQQNLHTEMGKTGDMIAATVQQFAMSNEGVNVLARGIGKLSGAAAVSHTPLAEMLAIMGEATKLKGGPKAAMQLFSQLDEFVKTAGEQGVDVSHTLLAALTQVKTRIDMLPDSAKAAGLKEFGLSVDMLPLLDQLGLVGSKLAAVASATGNLGAMYGVETAGLIEQTAKFHQVLSNLFDTIAGPALPTLTAGIGHLGNAMEKIASSAKAHPVIAKWFAILFAGTTTAFVVTAGLLSVVGAIAAIGGTLATFVGGMMGLAGAAGGIALFGGAVATAFGVIGSAVAATGLIMLTNPIALAVEGIALAAILIYEYWGPIKSFVEGLWGDIKGIFNSAVAWMGDVGGRLMHALGAGIEAAAMYPVHAIAAVAGKVGRYVIGHSPPPEGPLSRMYSAPSIIDTWAETMRPAPMVRAIQRVAAVAAISAPMMLNPAMAAVSPAILGSPRGGYASTGPISVVINPTIVVASGNPADVEKAVWKALREGARQLKKILNDEEEREARTEF